jgi:hypothetical protein
MAARAAAGLTAASTVTLGIFYSAGEPWGTLNDLITIALAATTAPIALGLAERPAKRRTLIGLGADLLGAGLTIVATSLLIGHVVSFEASLPWVLTGQALIGVWLVIAAIELRARSRLLSGLGKLGGLGLIATVVGFGLGGISHPLTVAAGGIGIIGTIGFYLLL